MTNLSSHAGKRRAHSSAMAFLVFFTMLGGPGFAAAAQPQASATATDLDARSAAKLMGVGVNIGNTLDNTATWETGWGNPPVTTEYIESLAADGFKTVRLPVAWATYARSGRIEAD